MVWSSQNVIRYHFNILTLFTILFRSEKGLILRYFIQLLLHLMINSCNIMVQIIEI